MAHVIVIGGGYAGVWCARRIARAARPGLAVTLVSDRTHHSFHGWTAEVLTGHVRAAHAHVSLHDLLPGVELVTGRVTHVDPQRRLVEVTTADGPLTLAGDHVVVAAGSRDASHAVAGLAEHAWSLKDTAGVETLGEHLTGAVARAELAEGAARERLLTVVVAGGGFTGIEVATAIAQRLHRDVRPGAGTPRVVLAHSGAQALPSLRPRFDRVADYAVTQARAAGVQILPQARLTAVTADGAEFGASGFIPTATVVAAIGQTPVPLAGLGGLPRDATGRLITDRFLRIGPGLWAGGDGAGVPRPRLRGATTDSAGRDDPCPANALWAIHHGLRIGGNIVRAHDGRSPRPFRFPGLGQGASLGVGRGIAELYGVPLTGWPAWLARWFFFHLFMPSRRVAVAAAADWIRLGRRRPMPAGPHRGAVTEPAGAR